MRKALVIGGGSIGLRHAAVLSELSHDVAFVTAREDLAELTYRSLEAALDDFAPNYVVIANETALHAVMIENLVGLGFNGSVLVEKPFAVPREVSSLAQFDRSGVGFNLRFHPIIQRLSEVLTGVEIFTVEVYAGQHLSTWRKPAFVGVQYSTSRERGGGVLRDLSHELDYLGWLFGTCKGVFARGGRLSQLTLDSDDAWAIVAEFDRAPVVSLQLNYLDTHKRRRLVINSSIGTIEADLIAATLTIDESLEHFVLDPNVTYRSLHRAMVGESGSCESAVASFNEALLTDDLITMIELSAASKKWIDNP